MLTHQAWDGDRARAIVEGHRHLRGPLLPVLHALQEAFGHIDGRAVPIVAEALNLTTADVHGVISFYHDFRRTPGGRRTIRLCRAEACQSMGADALAGHAERRLGVAMGGTTADGDFTLEPVFCLGNCALSPAMMIDDRLYGRLDPGRFDRILATECSEAAE